MSVSRVINGAFELTSPLAGRGVVRAVVPRHPSAVDPEGAARAVEAGGALDDYAALVDVAGQLVPKNSRIRESATAYHHHDVVLLKFLQSGRENPRIEKTHRGNVW